MAAKSPLSIYLAAFFLILMGFTIWQMYGTSSIKLNYQTASELSYMHVPKAREHTQIQYSADTLPGWDFSRLIDMENFKFLLTNTVCNESEPLELLVVIHSAPKNLERRNAIRETWGTARKDMKLLFMLGGVDDQKTQDDFDEEDRKFHDLVQGNFKDAYKNMTYKHIMAFKYTVYFCPTAKYVLKTDDDLFVNIPTVMEYISLLPKEGKKDFVLCSTMDGSPAIREPSKWRVPFEEYPHSAYPIYCSGFAVLYSYDVVFRLYREAQRGDYFWVDDAHVTGTLAKRINLKHTPLPKVLMSWDEMDKFIKSNGTEGPELFFYGPVNMEAKTVREMWTALQGRIKSIMTTMSS